MIISNFLFITIFIILFFYFIKLRSDNITYVQSHVDNAYYLVRKTPDAQHAANLLGKIMENINTLVTYLNTNKNKYPEFVQYIEQLNRKIKYTTISENSEHSMYTSYSVNKGEQIVFCLRSKQDNKLHDINLLMYVVLHELAHVACPEYGHTPLFKKIFAFLTVVGVKINIYKKINFEEENKEYCGLNIKDSII